MDTGKSMEVDLHDKKFLDYRLIFSDDTGDDKTLFTLKNDNNGATKEAKLEKDWICSN